MTIFAILLAALLGGANNFALHSTGVGSVAPQAAPVAGGSVTVDDVLGGGPSGSASP